MLNYFFEFLNQADTFFWGYVGFTLIAFLGVYLTIYTRFFQIRAFPSITKTFIHFLKNSPKGATGTHPLKVFFASVGGMIGIGNVVGIVTAVQLGGPGALFWVWIAALIGTLIKYSEIFLGLTYRVENGKGGYDGGPMFFLRQAFNYRWVSILVCLLLCIYGVEPYQFSVVTDSLSQNWGLNRYFVISVLLVLILYAGRGGIPRVGKICSLIMPFFILTYIIMCLWVICHHLPELPKTIATVIKSAFTGHAAIGGFAGSTMLLAIQNGIAGAAYSADIGVGYDSIIQSESRTIYPERQARLAILGVCIDNLICTMSILVVLMTGIWHSLTPSEGSFLVQTALEGYFPFMSYFMPFFLFVLGYSTLIAYFCVGLKCARFLHERHGEKIYFIYAIFILLFFSFFDQTKALLMMRLAGALLLIVNLVGIYCLRKKVVFCWKN